MGRTLCLALLGFSALVASCQPAGDDESSSRAASSAPALPDEMVWAWRRPETLTFLDVERTGVAAWMATVRLHGDELSVEAREWPLRVAQDAYLAFVVRIESSLDQPPTLSEESRNDLTALLAELVQESGWPELQIDFDARRSERSFYRELLADLRVALPGVRLSITGLLSWCWESDFLGSLEIDEVVPMIYRLGPERARYRERLASSGLDDAPVCQSAIGVSSDEPIPSFRHGGRRYLFHHEAWDEARYREQAERARSALG
ncbi:MAG: hypothetical protein AAGK22_16960 [Acidobacteriota bacterium]